ncbi:enoyl-CoA hydratase/isomerase family protein [Sphaerochaeta sp. PS]|uniref:enoyl-CoA hydratase/isomerase family protein n=1 Tax=Sphaerochaeta sp. PS TaxID=3076336 RepID=UPI0028A39887|nr:enoyl-CoA hydratase/isomerase family protein [Sphaerochaeta sp. PS]MDT4762213.1 enoyl-CoA hydratase/isomerase family protein [Sphaerochaeta sp. PS]
MKYENKLVLVEISEKVAILTLNRPPLNILTLELTAELRRTLHIIENDAAVRVVVLRGSGEKAFCAGADIKEFPAVWDDVINKKLLNENLAVDEIELLQKPVIAAMEGTVLGGGCEIALACDMRLMSEEGKIGLPEINLGVFPGSGGLYRLARHVGLSVAYEMLYTGKILTASEAKAIGLVNYVVPRGSSEKNAVELAKVIASKPFEAIKLIKKGVRDLWQRSTEENFRTNLDFSKQIFKTEDCAEGVDAFINKRTPQFK